MVEPVRIVVPDLGDFESVDVVEVLVSPGEHVDVDAGLITLESDKASMEVPSTHSGVVQEVGVSLGDKVSAGDVIVVLDPAGEAHPDERSQSMRHPLEHPAPIQTFAAPEADAEGARGDDAAALPTPSAAPRPAAGREVEAEVLVLGAGPGGYTAAFRAADLGRQVVLVEPHANLGGVCLNVGCIPSKALLHAARVIDEAADFADHGVRFGAPEIDHARLRAWKSEVVGKLVAGLSQLAERRSVEVVRGAGRLVGPGEVEVHDEGEVRRLTFRHAILATGSRPMMIPGLPDGDPRVWDSTGALELDPTFEPGSRLLVIGGGIIGLEMATVYAALGYRVTVVELLPQLLSGVDRDLARPLERRLAGRLESVLLNTRVTAVKAQKNGLRVSFEKDGEESARLFGRVLVAVGRRPNSDRIGAEAAGVQVDPRGFLPVDSQQRTNVPHIFAIGDLVPGPMLAHKAAHEGKVAAEVAAGQKSGFEARVIPSVAYTDPEVAWVGLTETNARREGIRYEKGVFPWAASGRALTLGREDGMTKLLFDPATKRIVGAGIVGVNAGDLIAEAAHAIEMNAEAADLGLTVHPHPTLSETIAFAAEAFEGTITDLYLPRRGKGQLRLGEPTEKAISHL